MAEALLKGLALGLILALSVGPVIFTIIKQSLNNGHRGGFAFIVGVWLSDLVLVVVSNFFSQLVTELLEHKRLIGYLGSSFLVALGVFYVFCIPCQFFGWMSMPSVGQVLAAHERDLRHFEQKGLAEPDVHAVDLKSR